MLFKISLECILIYAAEVMSNWRFQDEKYRQDKDKSTNFSEKFTFPNICKFDSSQIQIPPTNVKW